MKTHNFFAGPSILPQVVIKEAAEAVLNFKNTGLSILEMSHRSAELVEVLEKAQSLVRELLNVPDDYSVLFLSGGASTQFFMSALNLVADEDDIYYVNTGTWANKAVKEAKRYGNVTEVASSAAEGYNFIPKDYSVPSNIKYIHITTNNTVAGTQYHQWPDTAVPIIADMSSDIFSRPIPIEKFALIYAGAQKNMGPAGTTLVIVKNDILGKTGRDIPTMLDYRTHISKGSSFNTPPVYPIYVSQLVLAWLKNLGGVKAIEQINERKAGKLYQAIDDSPFLKGTTAVEDRSLMNVTFVPINPEHASKFFSLAAERSCVGLKGHRSVGGFRASIYNAMPEESVDVLIELIKAFDRSCA